MITWDERYNGDLLDYETFKKVRDADPCFTSWIPEELYQEIYSNYCGEWNMRNRRKSSMQKVYMGFCGDCSCEYDTPWEDLSYGTCDVCGYTGVISHTQVMAVIFLGRLMAIEREFKEEY